MILVWYIYAKNIHRKRVNMKFLYENLLRTYMSLAKDIFGNNQFENPSVQDAMYEAVNTNKFSTSYQDDVPLARKHYAEMRRKKLLEAKNKAEYSTNTAKLEIEKKEIRKTYYSKEKIKTEENEDDLSIDEKRKKELLNKYRKYKSMNRDLIWKKQHKYIASIEKDYNTEENEDKNNKYDYKASKGNANIRNNSEEEEKKYTYKKIEVANYAKPNESKYNTSNYNKTQGQKNIEIKEYKKVTEEKKYNNISYPSNKINKNISATNISINTNKYTGTSQNINTQKYTSSISNKPNTSMNINVKNYSVNNSSNNYIKTVPNNDYKKTEIKKTVYTKEEIKPYASKYITTKTETTTNNNNNIIKNSNISIVTSSYAGKNGNNNKNISYTTQKNYLNTEGNLNNKGKYETKIERKVEIKSGGSVDKDRQTGKKIFPTKSFQVSRPNH
jgi:hypothetical protein